MPHGEVPVGKEEERKSNANFYMVKQKPPKVTVGKTATFMVSGKVTDIREDEEGYSLGIEVESLKMEGSKHRTLGEDMKKIASGGSDHEDEE